MNQFYVSYNVVIHNLEINYLVRNAATSKAI